MKHLNQLKVVIVTHSFATGAPQELEVYLKPRVSNLMFIGHPFSYVKDKRSFYRKYKKGKLIRNKKAREWNFPDILMYLKDIFYTIIWSVASKGSFDIYIGADPLNAFSGLLLKRMGRVKKVVMYTIDYVPNRFKNRLINWIYHQIDNYCIRRCDAVWNLSERMVEERRKKGVAKKNQIVVPIGIFFDEIKRLPVGGINRNHIVYLGDMRKRQGLECIIEALPRIVKRMPNVKLIVIGTGELENKIKKRVKDLELDGYVDFKGFIESHKDVERILAKCSVGLAIYKPDSESFTWYTDPTKPKIYMACGLPVIITRVPWIAEVVEKRHMGIVINYNINEFVDAVIKLTSNDRFYRRCRKNAIDFARNLKWDNIFSEALKSI